MKKVVVMGMALCVALAFSACKSSESAYKKAYEKAKQQELAEAAAATEAPAEAPAVEAAPVVETAEGIQRGMRKFWNQGQRRRTEVVARRTGLSGKGGV